MFYCTTRCKTGQQPAGNDWIPLGSESCLPEGGLVTGNLLVLRPNLIGRTMHMEDDVLAASFLVSLSMNHW